MKNFNSGTQLSLFKNAQPINKANGTFRPNHKSKIHRWYPYLEGFASEFVDDLLDEFAHSSSHIHEPFAGTGTTLTVASKRGFKSTYSEINPFMRLVVECKTNYLKSIVENTNEDLISRLLSFFDLILENSKKTVVSKVEAVKVLQSAFMNRPFFEGDSLCQIVTLKQTIDQFSKIDKHSKEFISFARLALASVGVLTSEMKRSGDLRYKTKKEKEKAKEKILPFEAFRNKYLEIINDIKLFESKLESVNCINSSALKLSDSKNSTSDLIITSPPYLNGTNYFRNTKIELWLAGFIESEKELGNLRDQAMAAGINDISKRGRKPDLFPEVEEIACSLDKVAYDKRIPEMVRRYFSDTHTWISNSYNILQNNSHCLIDIGDSKFAGIHVPTDKLIVSIAEKIGFELVEERFIRNRRSKDTSKLKQVLLILQKKEKREKIYSVKEFTDKNYLNKNSLSNKAESFRNSLPYKEEPFSSRNWGHNLHSLCSYQGKLKPAIAHFLIKEFTNHGDVVLDPMSGSGSIPLEAFLQGRKPLANDLQELGYMLSRAKVETGNFKEAVFEMNELLEYVESNRYKVNINSYKDFGFNGKIPEYFNDVTYREILAARLYLKDNKCNSWAKAIVYSALLHILHGNRPYALSRNSHPVTPFAPSGDSEYRPLAKRLKDKVLRVISLEIPENAIEGKATCLPYDQLSYNQNVDVVITSPPFAGSTQFFIANWMRLWLAGWEPEDFTKRRESFLEYQQKKSFDIYKGFFNNCNDWLKPNGSLVLHVGKTKKINMAEELISRSKEFFDLSYKFDESVAGREKFGIKDQGATLSHQFLFFTKK